MDYKLSLEYREVALRPEHIAVSALDIEGIRRLIEVIESVAQPVITSLQMRPLSPDPDDDMVWDLALCGKADAIVTQNVKHFRVAGEKLGVAILTPAEVLQRVGEER